MALLLSTRRTMIQPTRELYLLDDEFHDTRAAGAVNATLATPGPGTRTVVDTGSHLSIAGGRLYVAAGAGDGDPGLWYDAFARAAGRIVLGTMENVAGGLQVQWGVDTDQTGLTTEDMFYLRTFVSVRLAATNVNVFTITNAVDYRWAIVLRAAGSYYFIKGGAFATWTLLAIDSTHNTATLYAALIARALSEFYSSFIRIPAPLWLPTPAAYDSFTRANGAIGSSETTGPDGATQPCRARTWNNRVGTTQIATNKASASALVGGIAIATVDTGTVDVVMQGTLTRAGGEVGLVLRYVDADNYVRAEHDGTNMKLIKRVATVETDVISAVVALGAGAVQVVADGTAFSLYLNNAMVGATSEIADAALQTGIEQGLFSTNVGNTQDAFLVMPRTGGNYGDLNRWSGVNP